MTAMKFATKAIHKTAPPLYNPRFYKETPLPAELHILLSSLQVSPYDGQEVCH